MCLLWSAAVAAVARSCLILWDPKDCSPPGSSVRSILQARILVWVAMPSSRASSPPRHQMQVSYDPVLVGGSLPWVPPGKLSFHLLLFFFLIKSAGGRSALRDPICYYFLLCAISQGLSSLYQFLENRSEQSRTQFSGLRSWERTPSWIPFSDCLQRPYLNVIYSVMPLLLRIWNAFWPFEDCYLPGFVFVQCFYCLKLPCTKIYKQVFLQIKHSCFTRDLGPLCPSSHRLQSPGPSLQRPWHKSVQIQFINLKHTYLKHTLFIIILSPYPIFPNYYLHLKALKISPIYVPNWNRDTSILIILGPVSAFWTFERCSFSIESILSLKGSLTRNS